MIVAVPKEVAAGESRVALTPDIAGKLVAKGLTVQVESGAGDAAGYTDAAYGDAGAAIVADRAALLAGADLVAVVQPPPAADLAKLKAGTVLVGFLDPLGSPQLLQDLAAKKITALAMEMVPRITRAQRMDALSSQSTAAGYRAALMAATSIGKFFPMLMTAAGTVPPAHVLILGAGVARLQAIATARRLGAVVQAFDIRPAVKEQVESLGATFVGLQLEEAETEGGYAKAVGEDVHRQEQELLAKLVAGADAVITTAQVPGRKAPVLITTAMVEGMKPGSVIIDLASSSGGNCELTESGRTVEHHGVHIVAEDNAAAEVAQDASRMYARNIAELVGHLAPDGEVKIDAEDEITAGCLVTYEGQVRVGAA
jgi:proton-translocating NAD(P)+ transhydrogenase subunit alpha